MLHLNGVSLMVLAAIKPIFLTAGVVMLWGGNWALRRLARLRLDQLRAGSWS